MKIKFLVPLVSILLLLRGGVLAIIGLTQKSWLYLLFSLTHSTDVKSPEMADIAAYIESLAKKPAEAPKKKPIEGC